MEVFQLEKKILNLLGHIWYPVDVDDMTTKHYHAWRLWKIELPVIAEGWLDVCVRAWDVR